VLLPAQLPGPFENRQVVSRCGKRTRFRTVLDHSLFTPLSSLRGSISDKGYRAGAVWVRTSGTFRAQIKRVMGGSINDRTRRPRSPRWGGAPVGGLNKANTPCSSPCAVLPAMSAVWSSAFVLWSSLCGLQAYESRSAHLLFLDFPAQSGASLAPSTPSAGIAPEQPHAYYTTKRKLLVGM